MDEPTKGIDVGAKEAFYRIVGDLVKAGLSIVMVSSDMPELVSISDRRLVLNQGKITAELQKHEISETDVMQYCIKKA